MWNASCRCSGSSPAQGLLGAGLFILNAILAVPALAQEPSETEAREESSTEDSTREDTKESEETGADSEGKSDEASSDTSEPEDSQDDDGEAALDNAVSEAPSEPETESESVPAEDPDTVVIPPPQKEPEPEEETPSEDLEVERMVIQGSRKTVQTSIAEKRNATTVVDALSAEDIGDIPALSIGEAIETLTGASSHREQGGATEISIRGMGPFLGSTVINGREATNGSGDRSVNFSQFPSELFTKIKVFKTQEASFIEGGVSGQIALETLRPLDYGKKRVQVDVKLAAHPDNLNIDVNERNLGTRLTLSYVDQFELDVLGDVGLSVGFQRRRTTNPEQEFRTSSQWRDCRNDPSNPSGVFLETAGNCDSGAGDLVLERDPDTGIAPDEGVPFIFAPSSRSFRQNITDDDRDSFFAALQWRPTSSLDINLDFEVSDRTFTEVRHDLVFAEQRRTTPGLTAESLISSPTGEVAFFENEGRIETQSQYQERIEDYIGGGLNIEFQASSRLRFSADASYSETNRQENIFNSRLRTADRFFTSWAVPGAGADVPLVTVQGIDVNDHDQFFDAARTRVDLNQLRDNRISAIRGDFAYEADWGWIADVLGGVRYSELEYESIPRIRDETDDFTADQVQTASRACRNFDFPESGFLDTVSNGQPLITQIDENGNVVSSGNTYATFRPQCLLRQLFGTLPDVPVPTDSVSNIDVTERTIAAYAQANYTGVFSKIPIRGNFGVRLVNTDVDSRGLRTTFTTLTNNDGSIQVLEDADAFSEVVGGGSYLELLPSFNLVADVHEDVLLRVGVFRGLSRPDPNDLGFGRQLLVDDNDNPTSISQLVGTAIANGNPDLQPLTSWNFDIAGEWYPDQDSILALGFYYKRFIGGFENIQRNEEFEIDGQPFDAAVTTFQTDEDASNLVGMEFTGAHAFTYLPGALSGLGAKVGMNLAYSDFEFEHSEFGDAIAFTDEGAVERVGITEPANLFGFSSFVMSGQLYYGIGDLDLQGIVKHRSSYFQQFITTPGFTRYIDTNTVVEARATYSLTRNLAIRVEAINIFDEPRQQFN
ncbi:MAG: TonB-dependent receptor, partial [Myxococcota bacterium]